MGAGESLRLSYEANLAEAARLEERARDLRARAGAELIGLAGELSFAGVVDPLQRAGWRVLHDRRLPRSPANIDHILVGPPGVVVVDSKNYSGSLRICPDGQLLVSGRPRGREADAVARYAISVADSARQRLPHVPVYAAMCFTREVGLSGPTQARNIALVQLDQLVDWLSTLPPLLVPQTVWQLSEHLEEAHPPRAGSSPASAPAARQRRHPSAGVPPSEVRKRGGRPRGSAKTSQDLPRGARLALIVILMGVALGMLAYAGHSLKTLHFPEVRPSPITSAGTR